jgi:putative membrane protein insertion efficiency factor
MNATVSPRSRPRPATLDEASERGGPVGQPERGGDAGAAGRAGPVARALLMLIRAYQRWISPALAPRCRFYPSCSAYAVTAIERFGAARGSALAVWRLLKCQPFHPGGIDHVPTRPGRE